MTSIENMLLDPDIKRIHIKICTRCIYDERMPGISFDDDGVCNYCQQIEELKIQYGTGTEKGLIKLNKILQQIKRAGRHRKYDCVVGVSGGTDSSYLLYLAKVWGLRPLAVHYDNTWNSAISTENIRKMLSALDIDLYTYVINNKEADDIFAAFFKAGVPEFDAATDLALAEVLYRAAARYGLKYILEGHSFITEGITPVSSNYFDGEYIRSIHSMFGRQPMKTYPLMTFSRFMWWVLVARIRKIRPFWYIHYSKEDARTVLAQEFGWQYYGGHHLENRAAAYANAIHWPQKFHLDFRNNTLAALARTDKISREAAWAEYNTPPKCEAALVSYVKKRLELSDDEYQRIMQEPPKSWQDYPTYKKRFEQLRPLFHVLAKANLVPMSFYLKYCFPMNHKQ